MNAIRWSEHRLYAALVSRVPDELHATLARAADLISAYAWLRDGTRPAGLDEEGKSLDGLEGPAFIRAVGRRYMRRWVLDDDGDRFGQSEAEKLVADWTDEVLLFSSAAGGGRRAVSWLPGPVTAGTSASLIPNSPPPPRALRTARSRGSAPAPAPPALPRPPSRPRTGLRSGRARPPRPQAGPTTAPSSASTGTVTRMPVSRAFRSSVIRCSRRACSPRNSVPFRYVRSCRSSLVRGSVRAYPVRSAPNVCISCAARARETPNSCSMSRRVSSSR